MPLSTATLSRLWQSGTPLSKILATFVPNPDESRLAKVEGQIRDNSQYSRHKFATAGSDAELIFKAAENLQVDLAIRTESYCSQQNQFIEALESGRLIAIGFLTSKGSDAPHELVPPFLFQHKFIDYRKSEFRDGEYRYAKVRVAGAIELQETKIGRPSIKSYVFAIAESIKSQIEGLKPGRQSSAVHRHGLIMFPHIFTNSAPSNRAIDRHLKVFWKSN